VNRDFGRAEPNIMWMTDITEHLIREGPVFCCIVLDAGSRKVVGWSIEREPADGTTLHSDHGRSHTSWFFSQQIRSGASFTRHYHP
jgi:putative transposase